MQHNDSGVKKTHLTHWILKCRGGIWYVFRNINCRKGASCLTLFLWGNLFFFFFRTKGFSKLNELPHREISILHLYSHNNYGMGKIDVWTLYFFPQSTWNWNLTPCHINQLSGTCSLSALTLQARLGPLKCLEISNLHLNSVLIL